MSNNITYRTIEVSDNEALATMIREVFHEFDAPRIGTVYSDPTTDDLFQLFQAPKSVLWVATENDVVLGCCGVYPTPGLDHSTVELVKFYLPKEARGKGIGYQLMQLSIQSAKEFGFSNIYLESLPHFDKAIQLYTSVGFEELDKPLGESGHSSCDVWMVKKIKSEKLKIKN